jgi:hypothetical protein
MVAAVRRVYLGAENVALVRRMIRGRVGRMCAEGYEREVAKARVSGVLAGMTGFLETRLPYYGGVGDTAEVVRVLNDLYAEEAAREFLSEVVHHARYVDTEEARRQATTELPVRDERENATVFEARSNEGVLCIDVPDRPNFYEAW